ncbi:polysaccharide deacetylase family protein [Pseudomonadota bacterium]|nr:polysaccharide deacetylase family protein [Pseudomonadota bacterium]|tara:strand:- start:130 stop:1116 length:987 start_codon:yes stop_codon:yes gene_type:complete
MLKNNIRKLGYFILSNSLRIRIRLKKIHSSELLTIINLHRVSENQNSTFKPMAPDLFEDLIIFCKEKYNIISFKDLSDNSSINMPSSKPRLIISFDDGYKDFIKYSMPVLLKHKVKVNQNIIPSCIETGLPPFNVLIQDFIAQAPNDLLSNLKIPDLKIKDFSDRFSLGFLISKHLKNRSEESRQLMMKKIVPQIEKFKEMDTVEMMTKDDLVECSKIHEIGIHSYTHASMNYESDDFFENDLIECRDWFNNLLGYYPNIYAFPNGSYKESQILILKKYKILHTLLVNNSFSSCENNLHNRIKYHANTQHEMIFRALGGLENLDSRPL